MNYIGIDIGGTKCAVVLGNENGKIIEKIRVNTTRVNETLDNIFKAVEKLGECTAIGVSCGGPLDSKNGIIQSPPNLIGWNDIHITDILMKKFNVPAYLCNDANACALAEWKFGAGQGCRNMIFLTFGTGLGAGLILDEKLYSGTNDMAGEAGHIRLCEYGGVGYGKAGSFEGFCSGGGIAQLGKIKALEILQQGKTTAFCKNYEDIDKINAKILADFADEGDETAIEVYKICGEKLGLGLSILVDILNPEKIVIGSIFARSHNLLWEAVNAVMKKECLPFAYEVCKVVPAELGEEIGDFAVLAVAMRGGAE